MTRIFKSVLALVVICALAAPASAQAVFSASGTATATNSVITFTPAGLSLVRVFNDGTTTIFGKFNAVPTAVAGTTFLLGPCEARAIYVSGLADSSTLGLITASGTSAAYRVEAYNRHVSTANLDVLGISIAPDVTAVPGCSTQSSLPANGASVASATAMPVPTGKVFHVTGTTTITSIVTTGLVAGSVVTLIFDGILTFTDGSNLKLAGNFVTTADDTITLAFDGTSFFEIARSVN